MQRLRPQLHKQPTKIVVHNPEAHAARGHLVLRQVAPPSPAHSGVSRQVRRHMEREFAK